jgi:fungal STAND N-terminal Goodbye domain
MSLPTASTSNFQSVLDGALVNYVKETGVDITKHPSANKLQDCYSPEDIIKLLLERETAFKDYRDAINSDLIDCLRPTVRVVHALSDVLGEAASLVSSEALDCCNLIIYASLILGIPTGQSDLCRNRYSPLSTYCPFIIYQTFDIYPR